MYVVPLLGKDISQATSRNFVFCRLLFVVVDFPFCLADTFLKFMVVDVSRVEFTVVLSLIEPVVLKFEISAAV